jgi:uncharacterized protein YqhQ
MLKKIEVGGQAVIEGVMMRSPNYYSVSIRNPKGKIITQIKKIKKKNVFLKLFFIRGIVSLIEMLVLGIKTLTWSANQQTDDKEEKLSKTEIFWTLFLSIVLVILFFVALPYFLTIILGVAEEQKPILFNLTDGLIKIVLFLAYLYGISLMKDVKTLFQYHGAEHKSVFCYEAGKDLTAKNVKRFSTKHPRCGTSFIFIVLLSSIFIFSLLPVVVLRLNPDFNNLNVWIRKSVLFPLRIAVIPLIAGVAYELLKLSAKFKNNPLIKFVVLPGILLQTITTKEPNSKQIEVAITALNAVLVKEKIYR